MGVLAANRHQAHLDRFLEQWFWPARPVKYGPNYRASKYSFFFHLNYVRWQAMLHGHRYDPTHRRHCDTDTAPILMYPSVILGAGVRPVLRVRHDTAPVFGVSFLPGRQDTHDYRRDKLPITFASDTCRTRIYRYGPVIVA